MKVQKDGDITIPADILNAIEELPDTTQGSFKKWEQWEDDIILKFYRKKPKAELAKIMGVAETSLRARYKKLNGGI